VAAEVVPDAAVVRAPAGGRDAGCEQPASTRASDRDAAAAAARAGRGRDALREKPTSLGRHSKPSGSVRQGTGWFQPLEAATEARQPNAGQAFGGLPGIRDLVTGPAAAGGSPIR
jgi:hypothetical protein